MQAVILAAGEGSRMRPLTATRPKVMLPLAGKPMAEHILIAARTAGIREFIFVVGYRDDVVRDYFGDGRRWQVSIQYCQQKKQLGTGDAVGLAAPLVKGDFLVMNGDIIVRAADIATFAALSGTVLALFPVADGYDLGLAEVKDSRLVRIHEKTARPPSRLANTGMYRFTPEIFPAIGDTAPSPRGEYEITTSLNMLAASGHTVHCHQLDYWQDLSYPWDLLTANEEILSEMPVKQAGEIEDNVVLRGDVSVGAGSVIQAGAYIVGPVAIGAGCRLGPNCYLRPHTVIGDGCHIGAFVEVKNCIIMKNTKVPHLSYIGDSVIGENCNFGAGTRVANLRLDKANINVDGIATGRRKLGAIIGDNVETGIGANINVGTIIGNNAHIGPGALASGVILPEARIF